MPLAQEQVERRESGLLPRMSRNSEPGYIQPVKKGFARHRICEKVDEHVEGGCLRPERLGIIGLGAIGGSVAWAATRAGVSRVVGYVAASEDGSQAQRAGAVTSIASSPSEVVADADLVVLAAPPKPNLSLLDELQDVLREAVVPVTDVTSVQLPFLKKARDLDLGGQVVASHPFCGTHESGFSAADPAMLDNAVVYVSDIDAGDESKERVAGLWRLLGASPITVDPAWHDQVVAWTSHLPQAISTVLAVTLGSDAPTDGPMGSGALDSTRLAASNVEMWKDLMLLNQEQILRALESFERHLQLMKGSLQRSNVEEIATWLEKGVEFRKGLSQ